MKAALVAVACVIVAYFGMGTADSGAQTIKARAAAIEAAAQ